MTVAVTITIYLDGTVTSEPPFHPNEEFPDLPTMLRYIADNMLPDGEVEPLGPPDPAGVELPDA